MSDTTLYQDTCRRISKLLVRRYSTSFSLGCCTLSRRFRPHVYAIYSFSRLAYEIVDSLHNWDKRALLQRLRSDTEEALSERISLHPILCAFQETVHKYNIDTYLINAFFYSMEMDLQLQRHDESSYARYIHGSAEVIGLMCLRVFCEEDDSRYEELHPYAVALAASFQKVNFLRDLRSDHLDKGRVYFPNIDIEHFTDTDKQQIEEDITQGFSVARKGISQLPKGTRLGVYIAYVFFYELLKHISEQPAAQLLKYRPLLSNARKLWLLLGCCLRFVFRVVSGRR